MEAHRRGLVEGRVGQGTFVVEPVRAPRTAAPTRAGPVDFTMNLPPEPDDPALLARMQASFADLSGDLPNLLRYQGFGGTEADKDAATRWLAARGVAAGRMTTAGFGESRPVAPNERPDGRDDPEGRQRNRRVTVLIARG